MAGVPDEISKERVIENVVVHPLVLLSVVDHFNRIGKTGNSQRVVGVLLGSRRNKTLDVSNSFAAFFKFMGNHLYMRFENEELCYVPFDEDDKDASVWYLDHDYLENMSAMFKKVNAKERIVGWYHTGPKLHPNDIRINEVVRRFNPNSVLVIIDAKPKELGLPTEAYIAVEEVHDDGTPTSKTFEHIPSEIGAEEAEEVGVEHLLRDIRNITVGTLSQQITNQLVSLKGLHSHLQDIQNYLDQVTEKKLPINHTIAYQLQDVFNLLPNLNIDEFSKSFLVKTNDQMLVIYVASMIRSVIALHNLIDNKLQNKDFEKEETRGKDSKDKKDKEKKKESEKSPKEEKEANTSKK